MIRNTRNRTIVAVAFLMGIFGFTIWAQEENALPKFPSIQCEELKKLIDSKSADILVVSNDPQDSFNEGHIPGAISLPWTDSLKLPITLPRNKTLVFYCSCAHEEDSNDMAAKVKVFGYRNLKVLEGGWLRWMKLKYPVVTSKAQKNIKP